MSPGAPDAGPGGQVPGTWRLLAPASLVWAVAAWAIAVPGAAHRIAPAAAVLGSVVLLLMTRRSRGRIAGWAGAVLLTCALLLMMGARIASQEGARADPSWIGAAAQGRAVDFAADLTGFPEPIPAGFGERWWVRAEAVAPSGRVPVLLWLEDRPGPRWAPGTAVVVRGSPELLEPASAAGFGVDVHEIRERRSGGPSALLGGLAAELRTGLRNAAERMPGTELVPGFAVGDTSLVSEDLDDAMLASSLTHLTAVSGANCALVVGAVSWVLAGLGAGRRLRPLLAGAALGLFVTVVGPDASVQRAAVMAAVILVSGFGGKRANALPALGLAVLVLLLADPWQALQPGFALSVVATAGILLMASPIADRLRTLLRLPAAFALPVSVALAAQLACGPLLLLLQPGIPAVGVLANAIAAPAAPLGTGLGLVAALLLQAAPEAGEAALFCAGLPARWVAATARVSAELPAGRWHWPGGWSGALLLVACQTSLLLAWALRRGHIGLPGGARATSRRPWRAAPDVPLRVRLASAALSGLGLGTIAAITLLAPSAARLSVPADWAVVACDVGQGDGLLLRDPARPDEVMLVDTGDDPALIGACLERFGVERIALAVLSHDDGDHVGALPALLDRIDAALIAPPVRGEETARREVVRRLAAAEIPYRIGHGGLRSSRDAAPEWEVLAPAAGLAPPDTNSASLVMRVAVGRTRVLLLGDTGAEEQRALLRSGAELSAEVIKVAHHGSRDQDPGLPAAVGAEWALVSVGTGNGYGHPVPETLAALVDVGARPLRTDLHGSIALAPLPGGGLEPWVERAAGDASEARP